MGNSASSAVTNVSVNALKQKFSANFRRQGLLFGLFSGITFGLYSAVIGLAQLKAPLSLATGVYAAPLVASAINDIVAFIWLILYNSSNGRIKEVGRSIFTFPGLMVVLGALFGGPIANSAYLLGMAYAGPAAIPISALCPMVGALFAWIVLKQKLTKRICVGMLICIAGAALISYVKPTGSYPHYTLGIICSFVAAFGWGLEGGLAAFGTSMLDSNVAINIREGVSGLAYLIIVIPLFGALALYGQTLGTGSVMIIIIVAALIAAVSFLTWYKANCMVGVATGTSLNITYVLFGAIFYVILLGSTITSAVIIGGILITIGAILVSMNPLDMFKKKEVL